MRAWMREVDGYKCHSCLWESFEFFMVSKEQPKFDTWVEEGNCAMCFAEMLTGKAFDIREEVAEAVFK